MELLEYLNPVNWVKLGIDKILMSLLNNLVTCSYWLCLLGGMIGFFLWIFGYEKGKNYPTIFIGIYLVINIVGSVLNVR